VINAELQAKSFEKGVVPCGMTAYDVFGMSTRVLHAGDIATNMCASACFPGLFQPVCLEGRPHIDGGVWDHLGLFSLPHIPPRTSLVVNVVTDRLHVPSIEDSMPALLLEQGAKLLTILVNGLGVVHPFNMGTAGRQSYAQAKAAMDQALRSDGDGGGGGGYHLMARGAGDRHWVLYLECGGVSVPAPVPAPARARRKGGGRRGEVPAPGVGAGKARPAKKAYKAASRNTDKKAPLRKPKK